VENAQPICCIMMHKSQLLGHYAYENSILLPGLGMTGVGPQNASRTEQSSVRDTVYRPPVSG